MLRLLGTLVTTRARAVLALAVVLIGVAGWLAVGAFGKLQSEGFDDPSSESTRAAERLEEVAGGDADYLFVVTAEEGTVDDGAAAEAGRELTRRLQAEPGLTDVVSYFDAGNPALRSADGEHALVTAGAAATGAPEPGGVIDDYTVDPGSSGGVTVRVGGGEVVGEEIGGQIGSDLGLAEAIAMPLILALLVLAFGNGVAALVTLAVGTFSIVGTFAELSVLGSLTDVSIYAVNLTTGLGLGLAVDYGLLMVARVREERAAGREHRAAVVRAVETAGRTILFSATTVAVALAAMLVFPLYFLRSFAYAGIGVMVITALSAVVLLPAALTLLGDRVDAWKVPGVRGIRGGAAPFWGRLAAAVVRRPVLTAVPVLGVLALMALPLLGVSFGTPDDRVLPTSAGSRQVGDVLRAEFTGDRTSPITVVTSGPVSPEELAAYAERVAALPDVVRVEQRPGRTARCSRW
ncbi:MMPL family transporter [Nocardioides sp. TF02-7]|uniref:MMPL family transporter n=1 Tax=Nocardioides sp. TF02-7 TaxID=2917724 RepID=UPI001F05A933|nr:MMPL family transporter [Nocardioides sp. TF02-7]UMG91962.1 MMPL family transporter [Nocardioides sp. TF02-7]